MERTQLLQEVRKMRSVETCEGWNQGRLGQEEAASILGPALFSALHDALRSQSTAFTKNTSPGLPNTRTFHYTPTSASWLNRVEVGFGILGLESLRGCGFISTTDLGNHVEQFVEPYNQHPKPFVWRKRNVRGAWLGNNIRNLCN